MEKKELRSGFTTGTCAAAAAKGAAVMLFTKQTRITSSITTYKGNVGEMELVNIVQHDADVRCGVKKDGGDDPDITAGTVVFATVSYIEEVVQAIPNTWYESDEYPGVYLTGGEGIGIVTRRGLSCPVGKPAINPVPRKMIWESVETERVRYRIQRKILVTIEIPEGKVLAEKTFNPKLGIIGGISVLGTTGVVEPMSDSALIETIRLEIHMKAVEGERVLILTPGNYGAAFLQETLGLSLNHGVKCSNYIGDAIACMKAEGYHSGLFVGHIGKLIKVAGGVKNTHSKYGDGRMRILWQCIAESGIQIKGGKTDLKYRILSANTTEEAVEILKETGYSEPVFSYVAKRIKEQIEDWTDGKIMMEVVTFSLGYGILGKTEKAEQMIRLFA